ncbi:MAG: phosphodiester glycosidase family protein [Phycisphaerae bacterium]|nr:phosphodiester glycosidase family protein [Phycisphaerae bacterium]
MIDLAEQQDPGVGRDSRIGSNLALEPCPCRWTGGHYNGRRIVAGSAKGQVVNRVLIFVAAFLVTAGVCALALKYLILDADKPVPKTTTTQPDRRRLHREDKPKPPPEFGWIHALEPGLDHGVWLSPLRSAVGDSKIHILRVDPTKFDFRLLCGTAAKPTEPQTARQWCKSGNLVAAVNAGLLATDGHTSLSLMQTHGQANCAKPSREKGLFVCDPLDKDSVGSVLMDLDKNSLPRIRKQYATLIQGPRIVPSKGLAGWDARRKCSISAVGVDGSGRILLMHVRSPYAVTELVDAMTQLHIKPHLLMLTDIGPRAQLYFESGGKGQEFVGSFEAGAHEDDKNTTAPPIPNVIGVVRKAPRT